MKAQIELYKEELEQDELLKRIKMICFLYLENNSSLKIVSDETLLDYYEFVSKNYQKIAELKDSLKVQTYFSPNYEIYNNLDSLIIKHSLVAKQEKITFIELTKDINYLEDILAFCYGILGNILKNRNI